MQTWLIYCHINKINGKRYIGLTKFIENPNARWHSGAGYSAKHHRLFAAAIKKYGWENFDHIILEDNLPSLKIANEREKYWIAYYHSYIGDAQCNGYNLTICGDGAIGRIMSEEEKEYRRQLKLGTKASEETKLKMSKVRRGKKQNMTAVKLAACRKAQEAMAASRRKKIKCIETNKIYNSITEASKDSGIPFETISACLHGRLKTAHKLHWAFIGD